MADLIDRLGGVGKIADWASIFGLLFSIWSVMVASNVSKSLKRISKQVTAQSGANTLGKRIDDSQKLISDMLERISTDPNLKDAIATEFTTVYTNLGILRGHILVLKPSLDINLILSIRMRLKPFLGNSFENREVIENIDTARELLKSYQQFKNDNPANLNKIFHSIVAANTAMQAFLEDLEWQRKF